MEFSGCDFAILNSKINNWSIFIWFPSWNSWSLIALFVKLVGYILEVYWVSVSWVISNKIFVYSVFTLGSFKNDVFYLETIVMGLLVNIKVYPTVWLFVTIVARDSTWEYTVDIQINPVIPGKAEANSAWICNSTSGSSDSLFRQSSVFAGGIGICSLPISKCNSCLLLEFL